MRPKHKAAASCLRPGFLGLGPSLQNQTETIRFGGQPWRPATPMPSCSLLPIKPPSRLAKKKKPPPPPRLPSCLPSSLNKLCSLPPSPSTRRFPLADFSSLLAKDPACPLNKQAYLLLVGWLAAMAAKVNQSVTSLGVEFVHA
jgi:hypothetical protein